MDEFLTPTELKTLTDYARREEQARVLTQEGIPFRWIGRRLIVSRHHARLWLAGESAPTSREPNMDAIR